MGEIKEPILTRIKSLPIPPSGPQFQGFQPPQQMNWVAPPLIYGAANGLDLATTEMALRNGAQEANPLMQGGLPERAAMKLGATAAMTAADYGLQKSGHPGWAKAMRVGVPLILGGIAASNYSNSRR